MTRREASACLQGLGGPRDDHARSADHLTRLQRHFVGVPPRILLECAFETFAPKICLATSFGPQSIVLMHLIAELRPETTIFYLDTELLFLETYTLRAQLEQRLGLSIVRVTPQLSVDEQARQHGPELWKRAPDRCCEIRKVLPLRRFLRGQRAWITGIRRDASPLRRATQAVEWDTANGLVKLNPLVDWSRERVWEYLRAHDLPFNPLHKRGYPSIGCRPCTRAVRPGEDERAGRWVGFDKTECGIHGYEPARDAAVEAQTPGKGRPC